MDFHINKTEIHTSFHGTDGSDYGARSMIALYGAMIQFDNPTEQFRNEFPQNIRNSKNQKILVVCAGKSEQEFLEKGSSFEKTNIKLDLLVVNNELEISSTLYLLKDDFDKLVQIVQGFPRPNTYLYGTIISVGGKVLSPIKAYLEGYCEGLTTLSYLHGEEKTSG